MRELFYCLMTVSLVLLTACSDDDEPMSFDEAVQAAESAGVVVDGGMNYNSCYFIDNLYYSNIVQNDQGLERAAAAINELKSAFLRQACRVREQATKRMLNEAIEDMQDCQVDIRRGYTRCF